MKNVFKIFMIIAFAIGTINFSVTAQRNNSLAIAKKKLNADKNYAQIKAKQEFKKNAKLFNQIENEILIIASKDAKNQSIYWKTKLEQLRAKGQISKNSPLYDLQKVYFTNDSEYTKTSWAVLQQIAEKLGKIESTSLEQYLGEHLKDEVQSQNNSGSSGPSGADVGGALGGIVGAIAGGIIGGIGGVAAGFAIGKAIGGAIGGLLEKLFAKKEGDGGSDGLSGNGDVIEENPGDGNDGDNSGDGDSGSGSGGGNSGDN